LLLQQDSAAPIELAQQLSAEAAATLDVISQYAGEEQEHRQSFSYDTVWLLLRPILRAILWLLPEHVMTATDASGPRGSSSSSSSYMGVVYVTSVATVGLMCLQELSFPVPQSQNKQQFCTALLYSTCLSFVYAT
jgi:hypothetical protein